MNFLPCDKKGVLSRTNVRAELPLRLLYDTLLAFRLLADIHPALGSGGGFQLLQGQLDGGVTVSRCRVDGVKLAQALVQIDRHALVHLFGNGPDPYISRSGCRG